MPAPRGYGAVLAGAPFATLLLAGIFFTPSAVTFLFGTSSHAAGLTLAAAASLVLLLPVVRVDLRYGVMIGLLAFLAIHFVVARELEQTSTARFAGSWALAGILLVAMQFVARWFADLPAATLERVLTVLFALFLLIALLGALGLQPPGGPGTRWEKPTFPFTEPSHFAQAFTPLLLVACARPGGTRRLFWLLAGLLVAVALRNLTLMVGISLVVLATAPFWQVLILASVALAGFSLVDVSYFVERLDFSGHTQNLSTLVYIQGLDFIADAIPRTWGWGVGFQQLGFSPLHSGASMIIYTLNGNSFLNIQDGGFVASKAISELGLFAGAAIAILTFLAIRATLELRASAAGRVLVSPHRRFCLALIVGYMVDIYVRGVGYFSATSFMLGVALFALPLLQRDTR